MNDDELRQLIRAAIQRHVGGASQTAPTLTVESTDTVRLKPDATLSISFGQYRLERAADDTMCIIEPAVQCNHCGFCKCHGH
jgi:hypothetical protein